MCLKIHRLKDLHLHKGLRQKLVSLLRSKGISDERILSAFQNIPRHYFLEKAFAEWAYKDVAFPIDADQTISQPYTVAFQTQLLKVEKGDKVLEIGTGSGFQSCVLSYIGAKVYTIERHKVLFEKTESRLRMLNFEAIRTIYGDGFEGLPRFAPFDKILVTAGAKEVPEKLLLQLKVGGIMVIPLGDGEVQKMIRITKLSEHKFQRESHGDFRFVPFLKGVEDSRIFL